MTVFAPILINLVHKVRNDQWLINRGRAKRRRKLEGRFPELAGQLHPQGGLWVCWPKKSANVPSDLDGNIVRSTGLAGGLVDNRAVRGQSVRGQRRLVRIAIRLPPPGSAWKIVSAATRILRWNRLGGLVFLRKRWATAALSLSALMVFPGQIAVPGGNFHHQVLTAVRDALAGQPGLEGQSGGFVQHFILVL